MVKRELAMSKLRGMEQLFAGRHFDREVIILCVRWYLRYKRLCCKVSVFRVKMG
jgi:transposase-like protein